MHSLRNLESIKFTVTKNFKYILLELLNEICVGKDIEVSDFPSEYLLDLLCIYDGNDRRYTVNCLKIYALRICCLWDEYSLTSLMTIKQYLDCSIVESGDILLTHVPTNLGKNTCIRSS